MTPGYPPYGPSSPPGGERAGFWIRVGSSLLDSLLYGLVVLPFAIAGIVLIALSYDDCVSINDELVCPAGEPDAAMIAGGVALLVVGVVVVAILYFRALGKTGQTWGRRIADIKVIGQASLAPIGVGRAVGRYLIQGVFGFVPFLPLLDILWMLWDDQNQTLHDKVVSSIVVKV